MEVVNREMVSKRYVSEKGGNCSRCQASFNSDGNITLRNYSQNNKNSDEILILSDNETSAIIKLFKEISRLMPESDLPF